MQQIEARSNTPLVKDLARSQKIVAAKVLFTALIIAGLVTATVFSGGALVGFIAAGAAFWKIGLTLVGFAGCLAASVGSLYFANRSKMYKDTGHNLKDSAQFFVNTIGSGLYIATGGMDLFREVALWKVILKD